VPVLVLCVAVYQYGWLTDCVGGLIVIEIFRRRRPVRECMSTFVQLSKSLFDGPWSGGSLVVRALRLVRCWFTDGWYNARALEQQLRRHYGADQLMFDAQAVSGTKVAVTTTAGGPVLLTNYRTAVERKGESRRSLHSMRSITAAKEDYQPTATTKHRPWLRSRFCGNGRPISPDDGR
jgi:hypothetical protein